MIDLVIHSCHSSSEVEIITQIANEYMRRYGEELRVTHEGLFKEYPDETGGAQIGEDFEYELSNHAIIVPGRILESDGQKVPALYGKGGEHAFRLVMSSWGLDFLMKNVEEMWLERAAKLLGRTILRVFDVEECSQQECLMHGFQTYGEPSALSDFIKDVDGRKVICDSHPYGLLVP